MRPARQHREQPEQGHRGERDRAQADVEIEQHREEQADEQQVDQEQRHLAGEELTQVVELAGALEDLAGRHRLEGAQRQMDQMVHHLAAERGVEPAAGVARDVGAQRAQQPLEHEQREHAEHQHVEGLQRAVADHLVVDRHQEDRRRQGEEVDHHRGDAELPQHRAQPLHDRGPPPAALRRRSPRA